jgi:hypothetical protein
MNFQRCRISKTTLEQIIFRRNHNTDSALLPKVVKLPAHLTDYLHIYGFEDLIMIVVETIDIFGASITWPSSFLSLVYSNPIS